MDAAESRIARIERKIDQLLEQHAEFRETLAEIRGEHLPERLKEMEKYVAADRARWGKVAGIATAAGTAAAFVAKKIGI